MSKYQQNHKLAKGIMCLLVCVLLYMDGTLSFYAWIAVVVWVFGVNAIAWLLEALRGNDHEHDKI